MDRISVDCIAEMHTDYIRPLRIRYEDSEGARVIKIDKLVSKDAKKLLASMNNRASIEFSFKCESIKDGMRKCFTLTYNNQSCRWHLFI